MIKVNGSDIIGVYYLGTPILAVYINGEKIWPGDNPDVYSCFAAGYWIDDYPWTDDDSWTD